MQDKTRKPELGRILRSDVEKFSAVEGLLVELFDDEYAVVQSLLLQVVVKEGEEGVQVPWSVAIRN